jgi:hypothetical protein
MKPIRSYFKRAPGLDGKDGEMGASIITPLTVLVHKFLPPYRVGARADRIACRPPNFN